MCAWEGYAIPVWGNSKIEVWKWSIFKVTYCLKHFRYVMMQLTNMQKRFLNFMGHFWQGWSLFNEKCAISSDIMVRTSIRWDDDVRIVLDQHAELDHYSASSLKYQSAGRHFASLRHIILIVSQPIFPLAPWWFMLWYQFNRSWFYLTGSRIHDLPHPRRARWPLHHDRGSNIRYTAS